MSTHHTVGDGATAGTSTNAYILSDSAPPKRSASSTSQRAAGSTEPTVLKETQVRAAWGALSHQFVRMCMNEITKRLFTGRGIAVHRGDEPQIPKGAFDTFLRRDMIAFARDALNAIFAIGVVPIAFRKPRTAGLGPEELAPYVPLPHTYTITTWADAGIQRFSFYWNASSFSSSSVHTGAGVDVFGERDRRVIIAHDFGFEPRIDGTLTSNMHVIADSLRLAEELPRLLLVGERIASNPPIILAYNHAVEQAARAAGNEPAFFAGDLDTCQNREDFIYQRNAEQQQAFTAGLQYWQQATGIDAREAFGPAGASALNNWQDQYRAAPVPKDGADFSGAEMPWARVHRMRVTDQHVSHTMPQTRRDYTQIMQQISHVVCGVLNVPQGVIAASSTVRAGVEATQEDMQRTVNHYADMLSTLMTGVYHHIFGEADLRDELRSRVERKRRSPFDIAPQLLTEKDLFEAKRAVKIRLSFDLAPTTTVESLNFMRNRGLLSWRTYGESVLRLNGMPADQLDVPKDPFTDDERKMLIMGRAGGSKTAIPMTPEAALRSKTKETHEQATKTSKQQTQTQMSSGGGNNDSDDRPSKRSRTADK